MLINTLIVSMCDEKLTAHCVCGFGESRSTRSELCRRSRNSTEQMLRFAVALSLLLFLLCLIVLAMLLPGTDGGAQKTARALLELKQQQSKGTLPAPRDASLPPCMREGSFVTLLEREPSKGQCTFTVHNHQLDNVEILYVSASGDEKRYWIIDYNSTFQLSSYGGDRWRLRSRRGVLLDEFAVHCAHQPPVFHLHPCAVEGQQGPMAPAMAAEKTWDEARAGRCGTAGVLSAQPSPGMHLLCLEPTPDLPRAAFAVSAFAHSTLPPKGTSPQPSHRFAVPRDSGDGGNGGGGGGGDAGGGNGDGAPSGVGGAESHTSNNGITPEYLVALTMAELERVMHPPPHQPAALFSLQGRRIMSARDVEAAAMSRDGLLLLEGGQWIWPAPRLGHTWSVPLGGNSTARLRVVSQRPRVLEVDEFLTDEECSHIVRTAAGHMHTSAVAMKEADRKAGHKSSEYRTSSQYSLTPHGRCD